MSAGTSAARLGVLAFGDSITNGCGEPQFGVAHHSWALWVARALGLPFSCYAADGARARDVVAAEIPAFESLAAHPSARFELGCLYIGVNDVRRDDWDPLGYERDLRQALGFVVERCDRTLLATAPTDLARPRAGTKVSEMNDSVERAAEDFGALLLDLRNFGARSRVMADHVHPTAFGQVEIAERALVVLAREGVRCRIRPSEMIQLQSSWYGRARSDAAYAYQRAKVGAREVAHRIRSG